MNWGTFSVSNFLKLRLIGTFAPLFYINQFLYQEIRWLVLFFFIIYLYNYRHTIVIASVHLAGIIAPSQKINLLEKFLMGYTFSLLVREWIWKKNNNKKTGSLSQSDTVLGCSSQAGKSLEICASCNLIFYTFSCLLWIESSSTSNWCFYSAGFSTIFPIFYFVNLWNILIDTTVHSDPGGRGLLFLNVWLIYDNIKINLQKSLRNSYVFRNFVSIWPPLWLTSIWLQLLAPYIYIFLWQWMP